MKTMTQKEYLDFAKSKCDEILTVISKKNSDYTNGGTAFANFERSSEYGVNPLVGLCLRMEDKWQRVKSYLRNGELKVTNEGIEDAFQDLIGYSLLALAMLKCKSLDNIDVILSNLQPKPHVPKKQTFEDILAFRDDAEDEE